MCKFNTLLYMTRFSLKDYDKKSNIRSTYHSSTRSSRGGDSNYGLKPNQRFYPRGLAIVGLVGCIGLSIALPPQDIGIGVAIALAGIALRLVRVKIIPHK
jgi:hypothetical protein